MKKKTPTRVTVNVRLYEDTHQMLKQLSQAERQSIAGIIHKLALEARQRLEF